MSAPVGSGRLRLSAAIRGYPPCADPDECHRGQRAVRLLLCAAAARLPLPGRRGPDQHPRVHTPGAQPKPAPIPSASPRCRVPLAPCPSPAPFLFAAPARLPSALNDMGLFLASPLPTFPLSLSIPSGEVKHWEIEIISINRANLRRCPSRFVAFNARAEGAENGSDFVANRTYQCSVPQ